MGRMVFVSRPSMRLPLSSTWLAHDVGLALLELGLDELLARRAYFSAPSSAVSVSTSFFFTAA